MSAEPTRDQILAGIEAQICPWCGAGPFKILASHTTRLHGVDRFQLRDLAGVFYSTSVCAPEVSEERRDRARNGPVPTPQAKGYKKVLSEAAKELSRRKLDAVRSEEQRRFATAAAHRPEAVAKRSESLRRTWAKRRPAPQHGDHRKYKAGCRCDLCKAGHAKKFRERRAATHCAACGHQRDSHGGSSRIGMCNAQDCACRRWRSQGAES